MRWNPSYLKAGVDNLIGCFSIPKKNATTASLESIRQAMLDAIGPSGASKFPVVQLRVSYANDVEDLWYLRGDLMASIANLDGEATARARLAQISEMFRGLLPNGLSSRPSPLGAS